MSRMRILTQIQTGLTVTKISKSKNHFQWNSQPNADELSRWRTEKFSVREKSSIRVFIRTSRKGLLKLTAPNQTLKTFLGMTDHDHISQLPNIPKRICLIRRPN